MAMTRTLIAGQPVSEGDALTITRTLEADAEGQTFEVGVLTPDFPLWPVGLLGFADRDYAKGEIISQMIVAGSFTVPSLPGLKGTKPAIRWSAATNPTPVADILDLRDQAR
jgi:hypothetical protein